MNKDNISKIYFMKESTSFLSLFSPSNKTLMKVCENSKKLRKHRPWTSVCTFAFSFSQTLTRVQISKIYNDNYILATEDIIIDNVSMHS